MMEKLITAFISKKRVIGWIAAVGLGGGAVLAGMSGDEFKAAVCDATPIKLEQQK